MPMGSENKEIICGLDQTTCSGETGTKAVLKGVEQMVSGEGQTVSFFFLTVENIYLPH